MGKKKTVTERKMSRKNYLHELRHLHEELVALQRWVEA